MFGFDKMFDFNRDGRLNAFERAAQFQFMDEMLKNGESDSFDDDDKTVDERKSSPLGLLFDLFDAPRLCLAYFFSPRAV